MPVLVDENDPWAVAAVGEPVQDDQWAVVAVGDQNEHTPAPLNRGESDDPWGIVSIGEPASSISQAPEPTFWEKVSEGAKDIFSRPSKEFVRPKDIAEAQIKLEAREKGLSKEEYTRQVYPEGELYRRGTRYGKGIESGVIGTAGGMAGFTDWITEGAIGKDLAMQARLWQQERTPDEPDFTDALASGAGSMATFFIPGVGIAKGAGVVARIGPRMAAWAGAGASGVMEAAVEAGGVYEDTLLKTKDINEAEKAASKTFWWNVPLVVITNKLGFLGETGGAIKRGIVSSQVEGFQELAQEYISTSSQGEKATPKDLLTAYGVGALTGGAAGAISAATDTKGVAPAPAELTKAEQPAAPAAEPVLPSTEPAPLSTIGEQIKAKQPEVYDQLKKEAQVTATDRRQDIETRKSVAEMTTEEMQTALLTDELTGLKNKRAYAEAEKKPFQVKSDVDGLKWINDNYGEDAGHALLKVKADALKAEGVEAYRTGGDEYYSQFDSAEQADEVMQTVAKRLESSIIESSNPDGTITRYTGGRFSYGIGRDAKGADAALRTSKEVRERAGERAGRGNKPIGLVEVAKGQRMGETGGEAESNIPAGEVEPLLKPTEIPIKKAPLELNKSQRQTLEAVKQEIEQGEPARRVVAKSEFDTTNLVEGGTYPDYFKGKGYTKKDTLIAINKALDGQPLTENQKIIVNDLNTGYRRQATDTLLTEHDKKIAPQKTAWDLNEGDKFKIEGENFKVTDVNQEGLLPEVTVKDGKTYTLKGDEIINYDKGSFKKTAEPGGAEAGKEVGGSSFVPDKEFRRESVSGIETAEPQKRSDIVRFLQEKLGLPIKIGRFRDGNRGVLGIFKIKPEVIRTKLANDIEVVSHEIGHALEKYLWPETRDKKGALTGAAFKDFANELVAIASKPREGQPVTPEGFAEFVRLYITNEAQAIEKAPNFYIFFEKELQNKAPEVRDILQQARADFDRWIKQPSIARVLGQISVGENKTPARDVNTLLKEAYTATVDDLFPLKKIVKEMTGKKELPAGQDPYKLARLLRGWWGKADAFLEYSPFDYNTYEWKGKSLKSILEPIKGNLDEFRAYIVSKRAQELQARGIESGIAPKDADKVVSDFDKKYSGTLNELIDYQDNLLRYLRDSGIIAPRDFARMKQANRYYVPFYRIFEGEAVKSTGKGIEAQDPIKGIKGSWRDIVDPLESIVKNTYLFLNVAERNSVGRALVTLANNREGMGKFVEKIPAPMRSINIGVDEVMGKWAKKLDDPHIKEMLKDMNLSDETVSIFRPSAFVPKDNVISVWEKGKRNLYEVDPDIARAFQALDKETINSVIRLLSYPARWLRAGATLTPEFIVRNPIRDQFSAFVYSKYGYIPIFDLTKGIFDVAKGSDIYWQWKKSGGEHSMLVSLDREFLQKNFEKVMQSKMEGLKDIIKNPIEALRIVSELGEAATRIGEFTRGIKKEGATKEGMQEAAYSSREVTLDFAKIGSKTKAVNAIIAFWNARVQGMDKMIRAFKDRPLQTSLKALAGITLPSIILAIVNHDDERWKEIPQWQKDIYWIVMTKDNIYRIPKPFELGIIFGTVPERIVSYILDKNPRAFDGLLESLINGAAPGVIPTAAAPFVENWANKSFFTDRQIVPKSKEGLPAEYQYQPYTTETAKKLGEVLSRITGENSSMASPAKIENTIRGLSGGLGNHILKLADMALRKSGALPDRIQPTKTLSDIPFIKAFVVRYPASDAESIQRFYDDYSKSKQALSAAKQLIKESEGKKAKALLSGRDIVVLGNIEQALSKSHKLIDLIYYNNTMTSEEKRQLIDKTYLNMIEIARKGNQIMDNKHNKRKAMNGKQKP